MGMRQNNVKMTTTVDRLDLLSKLRENLANHSKIVEEARAGYIEKARKELEERLKDIEKGKLVNLTFGLYPPQDYSSVYKTSISMLEWNKSDTVELEADEFRQLVEDQWDWTQGFLASNVGYSRTARALYNSSNS